jgi:hypothetical protein
MFRRLFLAAVVAALFFAAPIAAEAMDKDTASADAIKQQLDQPITLEITDQSLNAALKLLRAQTKINFVVDKVSLQQIGLDPDQLLLSVKLKDVKARSCLRSLLAPNNLSYAILGDTILISTEEMVTQRQMKQRVSVDVDKMDLASALKKLSKDTATNVMLDSRVAEKLAKSEVSLQMDDVPLETAVRLLAEVAGLKPMKVGNVCLVTTKAIAGEMRNDPDLNGANNGQRVKQLLCTDVNQLVQLANNPWNGNIQFAQAIGGQGFFINPINGQPQQPGNIPIPPLEKPAEKADPEDEKPAQAEKKAEPSKPIGK